MTKLIERLGLDWLVIIWGKLPFPEAERSDSEDFQGIENRFGHPSEPGKVDDALQYCQSLLEHEEKRLATIEAKAFALLGISGTATAFVTALAGLLLDRGKIILSPLLIFPAVLYILTVVSFLFTILLSLKVVAIGAFKFTCPSPDSIFELSSESLEHVKLNRVVNVLYSYYANHRVGDTKLNYLGGAQLWFRNLIVLLFLVAFILMAYIPFRPPSLITTSLPTLNPSSVLQTVMPTSAPLQTLIATGTLAHTPTEYPTDTPPPAVSPSPQVSVTPKP